MTPQKNSDDTGHTGPGGDAWVDAQRQMRERNDEARRQGKQRKAEADRRAAVSRSESDARNGVYR
jgi:hypothetical protein